MSIRIVRARVALVTAAALAAFGPGAGCAAQDAADPLDPDVIAERIELEDGGLDMEDELPAFGDEALFAEPDVETPFADPIAADAAVRDMERAADAAAFAASIAWGQLEDDRDPDAAVDWSGELRVSRGAIVVTAVRAFEGRTDHLAPRTERDVVRLRSVTRPARDGLELAILDPTPAAAEPLVLTYTRAGDGATFAASMAELVDGPVAVRLDDAGNGMVAVAHRRPVDACQHGFLRGRWHAVAPGRGRLIGRVLSAEGDGIGHIRGLWGERRSGERVFFGKFIDRSGAFRGIFRGSYDDGRFAGRWIVRSGDVGGLRGAFREARPDARPGGHFLGRWAETRCDARGDGR